RAYPPGRSPEAVPTPLGGSPMPAAPPAALLQRSMRRGWELAPEVSPALPAVAGVQAALRGLHSLPQVPWPAHSAQLAAGVVAQTAPCPRICPRERPGIAFAPRQLPGTPPPSTQEVVRLGRGRRHAVAGRVAPPQGRLPSRSRLRQRRSTTARARTP